MIDTYAPILPNESLGNILLRETKDNLLNIFNKNKIIYNTSYEKENDTRVLLYTILNDSITVAVDNRNSKIFRITAKDGYKGRLINKIKIGDTLSDVFEIDESFKYSERDDAVLSDKFPGVSLDLEVSDYLISTLKNPKVQYISVFAVESMTVEGQSGNW